MTEQTREIDYAPNSLRGFSASRGLDWRTDEALQYYEQFLIANRTELASVEGGVPDYEALHRRAALGTMVEVVEEKVPDVREVIEVNGAGVVGYAN